MLSGVMHGANCVANSTLGLNATIYLSVTKRTLSHEMCCDIFSLNIHVGYDTGDEVATNARENEEGEGGKKTIFSENVAKSTSSSEQPSGDIRNVESFV